MKAGDPANGRGRVLLVGKGSFLASHVRRALPEAAVRVVGHDQIDRPDLLDGVAVVVSFARHPLIGSDDYPIDQVDPDLRLAARIGERDLAHVMLSTRKVYAPSALPLTESAPLGPTDAYGRNKLALEQRLRARLGERLTVLRLANVFGYERIPGRRTFLSILLDRLAGEGQIRFDMSPFVERDFLPVEAFAHLLARLALAPPGGVLNVGSGIGLATGRLALWIIEGFGRGQLVIERPQALDPFVLDINRLAQLVDSPTTVADLQAACIAIGRRLREDQG